MKKLISALLVLTSCTHGIDQLPLEEVGFIPEFTAQVKGTATTDYILVEKGFGVFAATGKITSEFANDGTLQSFMENVPVKKQDGYWSAVPKHYWPDNYDVSFFAYAPYIKQLDYDIDWGSKEISLTYTPDLNPKNHIDLMVTASPALDKYRETVGFSFEHVLTKVTFSAAYVGSLPAVLPQGTYIRIDELELKGLLGTNTIHLTQSGSDWAEVDENAERNASYKITINGLTLTGAAINQNVEGKEQTYTDFVLPDGQMYLLPQDIGSDTATVGVTFSFVNETNILAQFYSEKDLPAGTFNKFETVRYNLTLDIRSASLIEVSAAVGATWIEQWGDSEITPPEAEII